MSQESAFSYIRYGQTPFFRLPMAALDQGGSAQYQGAHAVLLGVPFDGGTTYQPGARLAPHHVRRVSALIQEYHPGHRIDVFETLSAVDGGNVAIPPFAPATVRQLVQTEVTHVLTAGAAPFVVGGDHSIALPILRAVAAVHGPVAVLHVDAHLDTSDEGVWGEPFHHGTPFRHALAEGLIERGQLHQVGLRATWDAATRLPSRFRTTHECTRPPTCSGGASRRSLRRSSPQSGGALCTSASTWTPWTLRSRRGRARQSRAAHVARGAVLAAWARRHRRRGNGPVRGVPAARPRGHYEQPGRPRAV